MMVLVILIVSCQCMLVINGIDITVCKNGGNFPSVNLNCSNNDMIHVESITYFYNGSSGCGSPTAPCGQPLTNSDTGLISSCTGQPSPCTQVIPNYSNCTASTVNYRCIPKGNSQDMCQSQIHLTGNQDSLFLFSPNYPIATSGFKRNEPSCHCSIRSINITSITLLDLRLQTGSGGTRSNLLIRYGDITYNKTSRDNSQSTLQVYNHILQSTTTTSTTDIIFTHQQINGLKLWIEIQGISLIGFCNKPTTSVSPTPTTLISPPDASRPDSTITTGQSSIHSEISTSSIVIDPNTTTSSSTTTHSNAENNTDPGTETDPSTSSEVATKTSARSPGSTAQTATNLPDSSAQQIGNDLLVIVGCVVGGLVLVFILVTVCVLSRIRRKKANVLKQNVHVHINNTTNNASPNYFVLESLNTQDEEINHDEISTNPSTMTTGRTPEYAVVNKTGQQFNVNDVNLTKSNETGVSDMEILENELYIPYEVSNNPDDTGTVASTTNNVPQHRPSGDMEILENELYISYEASITPDDTGVVTNDISRQRPPGDMEIMENYLYVPFEDSVVEVSKPTASSVYDNADECGTKQIVTTPDMESMTKQNVATLNIEIPENDLYAPFKNAEEAVYDNASKVETKPNDQPPIMEILENDLYVPFEKTQV